MQVHSLIQGSKEWHEFRAKHFGASEAAAMLGLSKYTTRSELLHQKHTGISKDVDPATQARFDKGHETEALARPIIEARIGEALSPVTCSDGVLSCSCDGITFGDDIAWEHKQYNDELFQSVRRDILPLEHMPQCQQVLMITGADKLIFTCSNGTQEAMVSMDVLPDQSWFNKLTAGWAQFQLDLENYVPPEVIEKPIAEAIMQLPAVVINATGGLSVCNLGDITPQFDAFLSRAKTSLVTDDDFANGEATAKFSRTTAKTLKLKAKEVVDQIATVSEAVRTLELYADKFDSLGLKLEKLVKSEKEARKLAILSEVRTAYYAHVAALEAETNPIKLNIATPDFTADIKGLSKLDSVQNAVNTALANAKISSDAVAKDIRGKLAWINEYWFNNGGDYKFLFADLQLIIGKPEGDFKLLVTTRIDIYKREEAAKVERIQAEADAKARAKVEAEQARAAEVFEAARIKAETDQRVKSGEADAKREPMPQAPSVNSPPVTEPTRVTINPSTIRTRRPTRIEIIEAVAEHFHMSVLSADELLRSEFGEEVLF
jgi:predicted phage-related endonuclease